MQPGTIALATEIPHLALGLFFELCHAAQPADGCDAAQQPGQLGVGRHMRLDEDAAACGVYAACQVHCRRPETPFAVCLLG